MVFAVSAQFGMTVELAVDPRSACHLPRSGIMRSEKACCFIDSGISSCRIIAGQFGSVVRSPVARSARHIFVCSILASWSSLPRVAAGDVSKRPEPRPRLPPNRASLWYPGRVPSLETFRQSRSMLSFSATRSSDPWLQTQRCDQVVCYTHALSWVIASTASEDREAARRHKRQRSVAKASGVECEHGRTTS
jgi:hypothetical protein